MKYGVQSCTWAMVITEADYWTKKIASQFLLRSFQRPDCCSDGRCPTADLEETSGCLLCLKTVVPKQLKFT